MAEGTRPPLGSKPECRSDEGSRRLGNPAGGWRDVWLISGSCSGASSIWGQGCATEKVPTCGVSAGDALPRVTILLPAVRFGAAGGGRSTRKRKIAQQAMGKKEPDGRGLGSFRQPQHLQALMSKSEKCWKATTSLQ